MAIRWDFQLLEKSKCHIYDQSKVRETTGQSSSTGLSLREDNEVNLSVKAISKMTKDKKLIWKNQHRSTYIIAFYGDMVGPVVEVIRTAHFDFVKAFATVSVESL